MSRNDDTATIYTSDRTKFTKLDKLCKELPDVYKCVWVDDVNAGDGKPVGKRYQCPAKLVRFGKPIVRSEEQIEAARERGRQNADRLAQYRERTQVRTQENQDV